LILGTAGDPTSVLYQYNFSDLDPNIQFIYNTPECVILKVKGEVNNIGFCFVNNTVGLQFA